MNILVIDTTTDTCVLGLCYQQHVGACQYAHPRQHAAQILPQIDQLLRNNGCSLTALDAIAVSCGPGSFTGVRLGMSVAQGLAYGVTCPIVPLNSLTALAQTAYQQQHVSQVAVAVMARRGQCYYGNFTTDTTGIMQLDQPIEVRSTHDLTVHTDTFAVGDAWVIDQAVASICIRPPDQSTVQASQHQSLITAPSAKALLQLGEWGWQQGHSVAAADVVANYVLTDLYQPKKRDLD